MMARNLTEQILIVCPIEGVSVGRVHDRSTWRIQYRPEATEGQREAACVVMAAFDPAAEVPLDPDANAVRMAQLEAELASMRSVLAALASEAHGA